MNGEPKQSIKPRPLIKEGNSQAQRWAYVLRSCLVSLLASCPFQTDNGAISHQRVVSVDLYHSNGMCAFREPSKEYVTREEHLKNIEVATTACKIPLKERSFFCFFYYCYLNPLLKTHRHLKYEKVVGIGVIV